MIDEYKALKKDLAARHRLIVWDLPGLGKSKRPPGGKVDMAAS